MDSSHSHIPGKKNELALYIALIFTAVFCIVEVVSGILLNSLALLADAAHMFTDVVALAIALIAARIAKRPADANHTYGYHRFEILASIFNAELLFVVAIYIVWEAYQRFNHQTEVQSMGMLLVAIIGLVINLICMHLLVTGKDESLNIKAAYLDVLSDMLGSLGVIVAAIAIHYTNWVWIDPIVAVSIGLWILPRTWILFKEGFNILLEGVPKGVSIKEVREALLLVPGVKGVHELHLWSIASGKNSLAAHIMYDESISLDKLIFDLQVVLEEKFNILHTTLQCEIKPCTQNQEHCNL